MAAADDGPELEHNWPGLVADRDTVRYDHDAFNGVVAALRSALTGLSSGEGSLSDVEFHSVTVNTLVNAIERIDEWEGGARFADALKKSHEALTAIYSELDRVADTAVELIGASAASYKQANEANER
ncbi:hypothetical protein [Nonomuraea monospora]